MRFPRRSGILLHPTSLPGRFGIGDLGDAAYRFVDFLAAAGQSYWNLLVEIVTRRLVTCGAVMAIQTIRLRAGTVFGQSTNQKMRILGIAK